MTGYDRLLDEANERGIRVIENYPFVSERIRGLYCDDTIALSAQIDTEEERKVVLCEELTHALHSSGDILEDARMERRARERNFDRLIGLGGLIGACLAGCREPWEFAEYFAVPEAFFMAALSNYKERYGVLKTVHTGKGVFALTFEPTLRIKKPIRTNSPGHLGSKRKSKEANI